MRKNSRTAVVSTVFGLALLAGVAVSPVASASGMQITATGGDGTSVDSDGTQGSFGDSVQGATDDDGDQDAYLNTSEEATPQVKAAPK